jgi:ATP-dependent helicase HrpB
MLPIDSHLPEITQKLLQAKTLVLQAEPGTGKTTRVPPHLLSVFKKKILVLEPRRLAAKLSASRIAFELNQALGDSVGFQVRNESKIGKNTRLIFVTEGLFLRLALEDATLSEFDCIVLDEFHERNIHSDVALAVVKKIQEKMRSDLHLVVMSATLNAEKLLSFLPTAALHSVAGRTFPVEVQHTPVDLWQRYQLGFEWSEVSRSFLLLFEHTLSLALENSTHTGNILCFFSGTREIDAARNQVSELCAKAKVELLVLKSDASAETQERIFDAKSSQRKVILSTNIAETSLTLPSITCVLDSGFEKSTTLAHWNGLTMLELKSIAQASAIQRAGRAGRTSQGVVYRLFPKQDFDNRPKSSLPELFRSDLSSFELQTERVRFNFWSALVPLMQKTRPLLCLERNSLSFQCIRVLLPFCVCVQTRVFKK